MNRNNFEYTVGSSDKDNDPLSERDERPKKLISLSSFCISQCVLSIENLLEIAERSEDEELKLQVKNYENLNPKAKKLPATKVFQDDREKNISWQFAKRLCEILTNLKEEIEGTGFKYYLPTEAQWEVACRAGTTTAFNTGRDTLIETEANFHSYELKPVKFYNPNSLRLYQMHGNVWEFCEDYYGLYDMESRKNPRGVIPSMVGLRRLFGKKYRYSKVIRGGDFRKIVVQQKDVILKIQVMQMAHYIVQKKIEPWAFV